MTNNLDWLDEILREVAANPFKVNETVAEAKAQIRTKLLEARIDERNNVSVEIQELIESYDNSNELGILNEANDSRLANLKESKG